MGNWSTNADNVAIDGYDVVAYHDANEAIRGSADFDAEHDGVTFYFASPEHRDAFAADPDRYVPRFGGHCAFAVATKQMAVKADPRTFKLYRGNLLLFFNDFYEGKPFNTIVPWNADEEKLFEQAEQAQLTS